MSPTRVDQGQSREGLELRFLATAQWVRKARSWRSGTPVSR
jgi:hypothetical protein